MPGLKVSRLNVEGRFLGSLSAERGEILAVVGPSGSGKTTLVEAIAGLVPASGSITWEGKEIAQLPPQARPTGLVAQTPVIFPNMDVAENVGFGLDDARMPESARNSRIDIALAEMRITALADRLPHTLSGGQTQRTAVARTLARRPSILLLDEPFAHVDSHLRYDLQEIIVTHTREHKTATIYVTHDVDEAFQVADRLSICHGGNLLQTSTPRDVYEHPRSRHVAHILGISNIFTCFVMSRTHDHCVVRVGDQELLARGEVNRGEAILSFPPHSVRIHDAGRIRGRIIRSIFVRSHMWYDIETHFGTIHAANTTTTEFFPGADVFLDIVEPWIIPNE